MKLGFNVLPKTRPLVKKSSPRQIKKARTAIRLVPGSQKAERFHFRLVQQRAFDRKKKVK